MDRVSISTDAAIVRSHAKQIAAMLLDFRPGHRAWPGLEVALAEVEESLQSDKVRFSAVALLENETVGWIAGLESYSHAFEVHPIVVRHDMQRKGIGRRLLRALEDFARSHGALTVWLGCDDHIAATSLGGVELFPNVLDKVKTIRNLHGHAYEFYQHCGYEIVGVFPDVNGTGQPDIMMAKSLKDIGH
jgi:aminoglycoside 6'-N-acetyltransferase I